MVFCKDVCLKTLINIILQEMVFWKKVKSFKNNLPCILKIDMGDLEGFLWFKSFDSGIA